MQSLILSYPYPQRDDFFYLLETAVQAVEAGVGIVSIMDGRVRHCILKALSGEVFGTQIVKG